MGQAHILWVYEDGIRNALRRSDPPDALPKAVGEAVLKLSLDPYYSPTPHGGRKRVTSHPVLNHGNCVNHAADVHSTDEQIFVWARNCLRTLNQLDDDELEGAKKLFDALYQQRKNRNASQITQNG